jgi:hypothetical protein
MQMMYTSQPRLHQPALRDSEKNLFVYVGQTLNIQETSFQGLAGLINRGLGIYQYITDLIQSLAADECHRCDTWVI